MDIPFLPKNNDQQMSEDEIQGGGYASPSFETAPQQSSQAQWNYYLAIQREAMREEMQYIQAILEGTQPMQWNDSGTISKLSFPVETVRYMAVQDREGNKIWVHEAEFDKFKHIPLTYENSNKPIIKDVKLEIRKPLCNAEGRTMILNWAAARLQAGTVLSSYSIERIFMLCDSDCVDLQRMVFTNMRRWDINQTKYKAIVFTIMDRVEAARRRAIDNGERDLVGRQISVSLTGAPTPKQNGFSLGSLFGKSKY